jgi:hypothetical protein
MLNEFVPQAWIWEGGKGFYERSQPSFLANSSRCQQFQPRIDMLWYHCNIYDRIGKEIVRINQGQEGIIGDPDDRSCVYQVKEDFSIMDILLLKEY